MKKKETACNIELLQRIQVIIKRFAKNAATFARDVGLGVSSVQKYLKDKRGDWFENHIVRICEVYPQINELWLRTGNGDMLIIHRDQDEILKLQKENDDLREKCNLLQTLVKDKEKIIALYEEREIKAKQKSDFDVSSTAFFSQTDNKEHQNTKTTKKVITPAFGKTSAEITKRTE